MAERKGSSLLETRRKNRVLIKDSIFTHAFVTRAEIARQLGLTLPTITTSISELIEEGYVEERPLPEDLIFSSQGRRPSGVSFRSGAACAVGVELGPYDTRLCLLDLGGSVVKVQKEETAPLSYQEMLARLEKSLRKFTRDLGERELLGIGVGLPGYIDGKNDIIRRSHRADWIGHHLSGDLALRLNIPVHIDNNVRFRALGYSIENHGARSGNFCYLFISRGIACPMMVRDELVAGYLSGAGEIGHMILHIEEGGTQKNVSLDAIAGETAIMLKLSACMKEGGAPVLKELAQKEGRLTMKEVLRAQREGDADVARVMEQAVDYLGIALANVVNFINPGFVVVDGYMMTNEVNAQQMKKAARSRFFGINESEVALLFKEYDPTDGARGAAYAVIRKQFIER